MLNENELVTGKTYTVNGKGNDIFKPGEKVLFSGHEASSYIFRQGSVEIIIHEEGMNKFLALMDFNEPNF